MSHAKTTSRGAIIIFIKLILLDVWMYGWMDGPMDGWVDGWKTYPPFAKEKRCYYANSGSIL